MFSKSVINFIYNFCLPSRCITCDQFIMHQGGFCSDCWVKFQFVVKPYCKICGYKISVMDLCDILCGKCISKPPSYDKVISLFSFNEQAKRSIHLFKYYDNTVLAKIFATLICKRYFEEISEADFIVPSPMYKLKRIIRYYNQAELLAKHISNISGKIVENILVKSKWTKSQTYLSQKQREINIKDSIILNKKYEKSIEGKTILLIDDVITTGATARNCSLVLKKYGAKKVIVGTIATTFYT
jgi:ComF family protein